MRLRQVVYQRVELAVGADEQHSHLLLRVVGAAGSHGVVRTQLHAVNLEHAPALGLPSRFLIALRMALGSGP